MKVITMGEIMLRLMTPGFPARGTGRPFDAIYDGDEAIVGTSLAASGGCDVRNEAPRNALGETCYPPASGAGVDCSRIAWGGKRLGINIYETGVAMRRRA
jgi:2-dehydro-3-deoxygluconokinase